MDLIQDRDPTIKGLYVAYVDGEFPVSANRILLFWDGSRWSYQLSDQFYRGKVYGHVGPLPFLRFDEAPTFELAP